MQEVKLKRRVVRIDLYGEAKVQLRYPRVEEHNEYINEVLKPETNEYDVTKKFLSDMGMEKELLKTMELPDMQEIILILTGQKKI
jgi:hypothetical protein